MAQRNVSPETIKSYRDTFRIYLRYIEARGVSPVKMSIAQFDAEHILGFLSHLDKERGTPQGGCASAILANVYLHYVLDNWFAWEVRKGKYRGEAYLTRYADDFVASFQYKDDAERFYGLLGERLVQYGLTLAEEKTRILEFGRFAAQNRKRRQEGKPETFNFLGFTYYCTVTMKGAFCVKVKTDRKKMSSKLKKLKAWLKENRHRMKPHELIAKLNKSLVGYYGYYAVSDNMSSVETFRYETIKLLFK